MSAGGLSYSGLTNYGKLTLPSAESWNMSMNMLRDPPKMVMTRRKDKVGDTSSITRMIDDSGDRACEAIKVYARGVNPMVKVSYQNYGNNGGQRVNGFSSKRGGNLAGRQARLPYSLGPQGSFRPPVVPPQDLLPLSRLPRATTSNFTQPGFADFSKKTMCPSDDPECAGRAVRKSSSLLRTCVRPTATYQIEAPIVENFEVKYVIKNPTHISAHSGIRTRDLTEQYVGDPVKAVIEDPLHFDTTSNVSSVRYVDSNHMNPERYLQKTLHSNVQSNSSQNIQLIPIEDLINVDVHVKDPFNIPYTTPFSGYEKTEFIHDDPQLQRRIPLHTAHTNQRRPDRYINPTKESYQRPRERNHPVAHASTNNGIRRGIDNIGSRQFNLKPTVDLGGYGYQGKATIPTQNRENNTNLRETTRQRTNRLVMDMQQGRWS